MSKINIAPHQKVVEMTATDIGPSKAKTYDRFGLPAITNFNQLIYLPAHAKGVETIIIHLKRR